MLTKELERIINKYRNVPCVEIELRFGWNKRLNNGKIQSFDTNIQERYFTPLLNVIKESYTNKQIFSSHTISNTEVYYDPDSKARVIKTHNNKINSHIKTKIEVVDFDVEGTPFDIRIAVSIENLYTQQINFNTLIPIRKRYRETFKYKMWNYDLTSSVYNEPVNDTQQVYEIEIELDCNHANNSKVSSKYLSESLLLKINDIVHMGLVDNEKIHLKKYTVVNNKVYNQHTQAICL